MSSRSGFSALSRRQKQVLAIAALINLAILGALVALLQTDAPPEAPSRALGPDNAFQCEGDIASHLRQQNVAASVSITRQVMYVDVLGPDAAAAWDAFSVTAQLTQANCGPYDLVRVEVPDPERRPNTRLVLELTGLELQAWAEGKLSDGQLADRMRRSLYQTVPPPSITP
jgi:hypothetical protein